MLPAIACFISAILPPYRTYNVTELYANVGEITENNVIQQTFTPECGTIKQVDIITATYSRTNSSVLNFKVIDPETNNILYEQGLDTEDMSDNGKYEFATNINLQAGKQYVLEFSSNEDNADNCITLYRTEDCSQEPEEHAIINGVPQNYNLVMSIFEAEK